MRGSLSRSARLKLRNIEWMQRHDLRDATLCRLVSTLVGEADPATLECNTAHCTFWSCNA